MKTFQLSLLVSLLTVNLMAFADGKKLFKLDGKINGIKNGEIIYLRTTPAITKQSDLFNFSIIVDSSVIRNGQFVFRQPLNSEKMYEIQLANYPPLKIFPANKNHIILQGDLTDWPYLQVQGSLSTSDWLTYKKQFDKLTGSENKEAMDKFRLDFVHANNNSFASAYIILANTSFSFNERREAYQRLSYTIRKGFYGKLIAQKLKKLEKLEPNLSEGRIPDFLIKGTDGKDYSILEIAAKANYTLIDFWASTCSPCRAEFPHLKEIYARYKEQGFNIVGISIDKTNEAWKKALDHDDLPWFNGWDKVQNASRELFDIISIPSLLLINRNGEVIYTRILAGPDNVLLGIKKSSKTTDPDDLAAKLIEIIKNHK